MPIFLASDGNDYQVFHGVGGNDGQPGSSYNVQWIVFSAIDSAFFTEKSASKNFTITEPYRQQMVGVLKGRQCIAILDSSVYGAMRINPDRLTAADLATVAQDAHNGTLIYAS